MSASLSKNDRVRARFLEFCHRQCAEARDLARELKDVPELADSLQDVLQRIQEAAAALQLKSVEEAAHRAVVAAERGLSVTQAIEDILMEADALHNQDRPRMVVVASPEGMTACMKRADGLEVSVVESLDEARTRIQAGQATSLLLPSHLVSGLEGRPTVPLLVYGPGEDLNARREAAAIGAEAYLPHPPELLAALDRVRELQAFHLGGPARVLVVDRTLEAAVPLARLLTDHEVTALPLGGSLRLLQALENVVPDLIVLHAALEGLSTHDLLDILRNHLRFHAIPVCVLCEDAASEAQVEGWQVLGVARRDTPQERLRARLRGMALSLRRAHRTLEYDPETGCLSQLGFQRALDRELTWCSARSTPLTLLRAEVPPPVVRGSIPVVAMRVAARALQEGLRPVDRVARTGPASFAALLPECTSAQAKALVKQVKERYFSLQQQDNRLAMCALQAVVVDTEEGMDDLVGRAELALRRLKGR